jgi:hypothetical protein
VNDHFLCPTQSVAHLLYPAQAGACLEALCQERLYLATETKSSVPHPPTHRHVQLLYPAKTPDDPKGRQASQPKAQPRLREAQGHARKKHVH